MSDDDPPTAESVGSVQMLPLDERRRLAITGDRVSLRTYLFRSLVLAVVGVLIMLVVEYSIFHSGRRPAWLLLVMPVILVGLWTWFVIDNRRDARKDLRSGTYACYRGPLRLQLYLSSSNHGRNDIKTYKLVLGSFMKIGVDGDVLEQLQQNLPATGEADVAVHLHDLIEIRDEHGTTVFTSAGLSRRGTGGSSR